MIKINNLDLFNVKTIRLNKKNQNGIIYLVDIAYQLKHLVYQYDGENSEKAYDLCAGLVRHKDQIQTARRELETLSEHLLNLNQAYPRWKTRKNKVVKRNKIYWKKLYKRRLNAEKVRLESRLRQFEQAFPAYLIEFNYLYERVKHVCVS